MKQTSISSFRIINYLFPLMGTLDFSVYGGNAEDRQTERQTDRKKTDRKKYRTTEDRKTEHTNRERQKYIS